METLSRSVATYLNSLGTHIRAVDACVVTIGGEERPAARYTQRSTPPAGVATRPRTNPYGFTCSANFPRWCGQPRPGATVRGSAFPTLAKNGTSAVVTQITF